MIAQIHMYTCVHELADGIGSASWSDFVGESANMGSQSDASVVI